LKKKDPRHLYTASSHPPNKDRKFDDYFVGAHTEDGAFMKEDIDPCPNTDYQLFKETFSKSDVILHARMNENWPEVFPELYHPDMRLILQIPLPAPDKPADENEKMLERLMLDA